MIRKLIRAYLRKKMMERRRADELRRKWERQDFEDQRRLEKEMDNSAFRSLESAAVIMHVPIKDDPRALLALKEGLLANRWIPPEDF